MIVAEIATKNARLSITEEAGIEVVTVAVAIMAHQLHICKFGEHLEYQLFLFRRHYIIPF